MYSDTARRRWLSPSGTSLLRQSDLIERTKRSAIEFRSGLTRGQPQALHPCCSKHVTELIGEQRIPVMKQIPLADQKPFHAVGEVACDLLHPRAMGLPNHAADLHPSGLEVDREQHEVANEPLDPTLDSPSPGVRRAVPRRWRQ